MSNGSELTAPVLLLAMPQVLDPFFHRSVVLLAHHEEEGSFGFIVNRPTGIRVSEILSGMEVSWRGRDEAVAYFGGPVQPQLGTVLWTPDAARPIGETASEILPGVAITQHIGDLSNLAESPPDRFRLILGYAGWGAGQLLDEILRNDWLTAPVDTDLIFSPDPERIWANGLRSVGVDPAALPSWTTVGGGGEETTN
jgi:putative transcriptional regulator